MTAHQALGRIHGNGAHGVFTKMLGDFKNEAVAAVLGFERIQDLRQVAVELHVDYGAHDLPDAAYRAVGNCCGIVCHILDPSSISRALQRPK